MKLPWLVLTFIIYYSIFLQVKAHQFFRGVDWDNLALQKVGLTVQKISCVGLSLFSFFDNVSFNIFRFMISEERDWAAHFIVNYSFSLKELAPSSLTILFPFSVYWIVIIS